MTDWLAAPDNSLQLQDKQIDIWLFHLNTSPQRIKHFYPLLSEEEKERSERFIDFKQRKRFISSHGFMRSVLSHYLDTPANSLVFNKSDNGKPFLVLKHDQPDIKFNLSHSHNMALLGVCKNNEIGIDIEYMSRKNNWQGLIKRFFTETEQNSIFSLPDDRQQQAFFKTWTRKEAHMKVTGQGLHLSPARFTVSTPPDPARLIEYIDDNSIDSQQWQMDDVVLPELAADYCACLSYEGEISNINYYIAI